MRHDGYLRAAARRREFGSASASPSRARSERGDAAVEFLLIAPLLVGITMLLLQWSVRLEAERIVQTAAREGAVAAARWDGSAAAGDSAARQYLDRLDPSIDQPDIDADRGTTVARVTVAANVLTLVPGFEIHVASTAEQPIERFTP